MRKHCKRTSRPISALITPDQHTELILAPRLHLEMLLTQEVADEEYQHSVLGVYTLASVLAHMKNKPETQQYFEKAQRIMIQLIKEVRSPNLGERDFLLECFNQADCHFGIQHQETLVQAIRMVVKMNESPRNP
jgi:hypothetical protein